jgi:hypothetical protein
MRTVDTKRGVYWVHTYVGHPLYKYYPAENRWETVTTTDNWETSNYNAMEYFPELDCIISYYGRSGTVRKLDLNTLTWTGVGSIAGAGYHAQMEYNPVYKVMIFGGGDNNVPLHQMDVNGNITQLTTTPVSASLSVSEFSIDPVSGDLLLLTPKALHAFNMDTKKWSQVSFNPSAVGSFLAGIGPHAMLFGQVPSYGCNILLNTTTYNVLVYKHSEGGLASEKLPVSTKGDIIDIFPNPFKPVCNIKVRREAYDMKRVSLQIYNTSGKQVANLTPYASRITPYAYPWNASHLPSGIYLARLTIDGNLTATARLILSK